MAAKLAIGAAAVAGVAIGGMTAGWAALDQQAKLATRRIGLAETPPPQRDGIYLPSGAYRRGQAKHRLSAWRLVMLGDSSSAGFGAADADGVPGVMLARGLAAESGRPVQLITYAVVGSGAADLARQTDLALRQHPDVVVIVVGPNDVRDRVSPTVSADQLSAAVRILRAASIAVVVGTCPDLSVIAPIPQPLRQLAGHWSRTLAERQEAAVKRAGGIAVPIARIVSPEFATNPDLFSPDGFHPSAAGYARAVRALLPAVRHALGLRPPPTTVPDTSVRVAAVGSAAPVQVDVKRIG